MNRSVDAVPRTQSAWAGFGESAEIAEVRRENQEFRAGTLKTNLGLRSALQYVLQLLHAHQGLARQAQLVTTPDLGASSSTPSADHEVAADPGGQG